MSKNIAFFADGTWNGPGLDDNRNGIPEPTNVFELFDALIGTDSSPSKLLQDEQEKIAVDAEGQPKQVAKYVHGVGDSRNPLVRFLGNGFGAGLVTRIVRGYTFISRNYDRGDAIYICGFSRGAYTARALAGLIATVGLLDRQKLDLENRKGAYQLGITAWTEYRAKAGKRGSFLSFLRSKMGTPLSDAYLVPDIEIRAVAVWDTIGARGIPEYAADGARLDLYEFADTALSRTVKHGLHAVSIDEQRSDFVPTLWDAAPNVTQVWFSGAHADVGGGYPDRQLSDITLGWMADELIKDGLLIRSGVASPSDQRDHGPMHRPWEMEPWNHLPKKSRTIPRDSVLHPSVALRSKAVLDYESVSLIRFLEETAGT